MYFCWKWKIITRYFILFQYCLKLHIETDHPDYEKYTELSYKCLNCTYVYPSYLKIQEHFYEAHPESKMYRCPHPGCCKIYKVLKYIKLHLKKPHPTMKPDNFDVQPCEICGITLKSTKALNQHMIMKHRREKLGYMCRICKERFQSIEQR